MGIRINKVIGYGLTDFLNEDGDFDDKFSDHVRERPYDWYNVDDFKQHCISVADRYKKKDGTLDKSVYDNGNDFNIVLAARFMEDDPSCINDELFVFNDSEDGDSACVFIPLDSPKWYRFDDTLDYYDNEMVDNVKLLHRPIFPHIFYINKNTGEQVDRMIEQKIYHLNNTSRDDIKRYFLQDLGVENHWSEKFNTGISPLVVEFCKFTNVFKDEKTIYSLEPMIYTFWR